MLVSVIIPMFNAQAWIHQTLKSVLSQGMRELEIIAIDDGSSDDTARIVSREFADVKLVSQQHKGASNARNLGTALSKGEFIQYLDADDLLVQDKLRLQLDTLQSTHADIAYGAWQKITQSCDGKISYGEIVQRQLKDPEIELFTDFWSPPAAYLFRRRFLENAVIWNENLPVIQDARFVLDCALHGARFVYCPGLMAYYRDRVCGSLSNKDPVAFICDCMRNAQDVALWWQAHGGMSARRKKALLDVYGYIAREGFIRHRQTFERAYNCVNELVPIYVPEKLRLLYFIYRFIGWDASRKLLAVYKNARCRHPRGKEQWSGA